MKELFKELEAVLKSLTNKRGDKLFPTVELNSGQMQKIKGFENSQGIILFPAVFYKPEEIVNNEVMPETFDNNQIYELNYWMKYWNTNSYEYRSWIDINDPNENPDYKTPMEIIQPYGFIDDDYVDPSN